jgi:NAD(P)-dependent dehydrogenase (short-subunit alcohol dehydrogenase family)
VAERGPIAFVTGAGSGIGRAVSLALAREGYTVCLFGRRKDRLEETAQQVGKADMLVLPGDVSDPEQVTRAFALAADAYGRLDLLFNNAGVSATPNDIDELSIEAWQNVIQVNVNGAFYCARAAFAQMRRQKPQGGRIINNGSISAHSPRPKSAAYTISKHAITGLTRSLALDGRPYDIACGQIDIGNAGTDITRQIAVGMPQPDGAVRAEPVIDVADVASAVLMMARLPLSANVPFMTIMATKMPFMGRG